MQTRSKLFSVSLLLVAEMAGMSLSLASAAVLPDMAREGAISSVRQALLSSGVQAGFVVGALIVSISGVAARLDPRRFFIVSALLAAVANGAPAGSPPGGNVAMHSASSTGVCWPAFIRSA